VIFRGRDDQGNLTNVQNYHYELPPLSQTHTNNFLIIKISKEMRGRKERISSLRGKAEDGDIAQRLTAYLESTRL
jgi:hypothetical protein